MIRVTFKLLSDILKIFKYQGEILVYWQGTLLETISEDSEISDLKDIPESCSVYKDFYVKFPTLDEVTFGRAMTIVNNWENE